MGFPEVVVGPSAFLLLLPSLTLENKMSRMLKQAEGGHVCLYTPVPLLPMSLRCVILIRIP